MCIWQSQLRCEPRQQPQRCLHASRQLCPIIRRPRRHRHIYHCLARYRPIAHTPFLACAAARISGQWSPRLMIPRATPGDHGWLGHRACPLWRGVAVGARAAAAAARPWVVICVSAERAAQLQRALDECVHVLDRRVL
jgi:hypothetical protein